MSTAMLRMLVLDDEPLNCAASIAQAFEQFVEADSPPLALPSRKGSTLRIVGLGPDPIALEIVSNSYEARDVDKAAREAMEDEREFDIVLVDDQWPGERLGGQKVLLPLILEHVRGVSKDLPLVALYTSHWGDPAEIRHYVDTKGRYAGEAGRITGCSKEDYGALIMLVQSAARARALIEDCRRLADKERARGEKERIERRRRLLIPEDAALPDRLDLPFTFVGQSERMREVFYTIQLVATRVLERWAESESKGTSLPTILITGESGSGKELVADAIHHLGMGSLGGSLVPLHLASVPPHLIGNELFGHERGAFTGANRTTDGLIAKADGGVLFLDEIGELPPEIQIALLRVLESGEFRRVGGTEVCRSRFQLVSATHRDLHAMVASGSFRLDLKGRISDLVIAVPSLSERPEDIEGLLYSFVRAEAPEKAKSFVVQEDALAFLMNREWPEHVRGLRAFVRRMLMRGPVTLDLNAAKALVTDCVSESEGRSDGLVFPPGRDPALMGRAIKLLERCEEGARICLSQSGATSKITLTKIARADGCTPQNLSQQITEYRPELLLVLAHNPNRFKHCRPVFELRLASRS